MLILGPLGFATPWLLAAMASLPILWLILRATPPSPRRMNFPAVRLLLGLRDRSPVAQRTPWWLLLLRIAAIGLLIMAFAGPVWKPVVTAPSSGPLLVILDAGWAAASDWPARQDRAERALKEAATSGRPAALMLADGQTGDAPITFAPADTLLAGLRGAMPQSWQSRLPTDVTGVLANVPEGQISTLWISDGLRAEGQADWLTELVSRGPVHVVLPQRSVAALTLDQTDAPALVVHSNDERPREVLAIGPDPQGIERELARLSSDDVQSTEGTFRQIVAIDLPSELRNRITRFEIADEATAGAVLLADDRVRRRKVGLVGDDDAAAEGQQLLSPLYYLRRALGPKADLIEGGLGDVLNAAPDLIILADQVGMVETDALTDWVRKGGLLIRFAGPRMAVSDRLDTDPLLPVRLRPGGRDIGGALSWGNPRGLDEFASDGIFAGLLAPEDVTIRAQLMAEPSPDLAQHTIAALSDGTPLMTRSALDEGQVVLVHVTANAEWSNLPLSGLFVQMLERLVESARVTLPDQAAQLTKETAPFWTAELVLDGFGNAVGSSELAPVSAEDIADGPGPDQPAGIYIAGARQKALNAGAALDLATWPGARVEDQSKFSGHDLKGAFIAIAALLMALDALGSAFLARGGPRRTAVGVGVAALWMSAFPFDRASAQDALPRIDAELIRAADEGALAYVLTGEEAIDETSAQGLAGLTRALTARTSIQPGIPIAIDLDTDDLSVLTFLYWPVTDSQPAPSPQAYVRLNHFLRSGGMIMFDTRDGDIAGVGGPDMGGDLQRLASPLDIPPLAPLPEDHVLTRSFYLLDDFPGRWQGANVWVEAPPVDAEQREGIPFRNLNDGVSPVLMGGNAWAEAWAIDRDGVPVFPVGRGFEGERQREMAFRSGINLIMYVLTGNYKSDQVHVPALLERLREESGQIRMMP